MFENIVCEQISNAWDSVCTKFSRARENNFSRKIQKIFSAGTWNARETFPKRRETFPKRRETFPKSRVRESLFVQSFHVHEKKRFREKFKKYFRRGTFPRTLRNVT